MSVTSAPQVNHDGLSCDDVLQANLDAPWGHEISIAMENQRNLD
jgi:hypothetical protein